MSKGHVYSCICATWFSDELADEVKFLSGEHRRERVISAKEEGLYLTSALPLLHDVSVLLFDTGMRPEECHRWKAAGEAGEGWVWPAETRDGHINHDSLKLQHKEALKLANVRPFEVYSIRHTFLTRLGESGCDVWTLARVAGHSNIGISQRYVYPSEDAVLNALSRLSGHNLGHSEENAIQPKSSGPEQRCPASARNCTYRQA